MFKLSGIQAYLERLPATSFALPHPTNLAIGQLSLPIITPPTPPEINLTLAAQLQLIFEQKINFKNITIRGEITDETLSRILTEKEFKLTADLKKTDILITANPQDLNPAEIKEAHEFAKILGLVASRDQGNRLIKLGKIQGYLDLSYSRSPYFETEIRSMLSNLYAQSQLEKSRNPFSRIESKEKFIHTLDKSIHSQRKTEVSSSLAVFQAHLPAEVGADPELKMIYLQTFVENLRLNLRVSDLLGRIGENEFAVLFSGTPKEKSIPPVLRAKKSLQYMSAYIKNPGFAMSAWITDCRSQISAQELLNRALSEVGKLAPWKENYILETIESPPPPRIDPKDKIIESYEKQLQELKSQVQAQKLAISVALHKLKNSLAPLIGLANFENILNQIHNLHAYDTESARILTELIELLNKAQNPKDIGWGLICLEQLKKDTYSVWEKLEEISAVLPTDKALENIKPNLVRFELNQQFFNEIVAKYGQCTAGSQRITPAGITFNYVIEDFTPQNIFVDPVKLDSILMNLINNALKYCRAGGNLTFSVSETRDYLRIRFSDQGPGIPADKLKKIFKEKERIGAEESQTEGSGMGLYAVKKLAKDGGIRIQVESTLGQGTAFTLTVKKDKRSDGKN